VTGGDVAVLLRHRRPALRLGRWTREAPDRIACTSHGAGPWRWADLLEGAAQSAGLLAGLQPGGPCNTAVIAEYRDVVVHAPAHDGPARFTAALDRRVLGFWRCRVAVAAADGRPLLEAIVTVAPERHHGP